MEECEVDEVCVDKENKVVTTPAFMYDATFAQVGGESMHKDQCFGVKPIKDLIVGNSVLHFIRIETTMLILIQMKHFRSMRIQF